MSEQSITPIGKIVIGMTVIAVLLSVIATVISYFRFGKVNVMSLLSGLITSVTAILIVTMKKPLLNITRMKNQLPKTANVVFSVAFLTLSFVSLFAQEKSPLERLHELNRTGKWEEAAQKGKNILDSNQAKSVREKCEIYQSLVYSLTRLKRPSEIETARAIYDKPCQDVLGKTLSPAELKMSAPAPQKDGFWETSSPAKSNLNPKFLEAHQGLCERTGADACLVIKNGKIVQEIYSNRYRLPMYAMSSTKSIAGILFGMLLDDGKIKSVDEPVCNYFKEWCAGEKVKVTLRHLLSMTSGLPRKYDNGVSSVGDKNPFVIAEPLVFEPGKKWNYSNEGVQLLSPILDKAAGEPIQDYARKRLFEPLGMRDTKLHLDTKGHAWTYADMETSARDFARIGLLMLSGGEWKNKQIVSRRWIEQSVQPSQTLNAGYGFLWWLYENPKGYGAQGYLDTNLYVFPAADLIIVRMQSKPINPQPSYEAEALKLFEQTVGK